MKKHKFICTCSLLFLFYSGVAQYSKCTIGIEGGVGFRTLRYNEVIDKYNKSIFGYSGAIAFQLNFNEIISLHTTLGYEMKGTKTMAAIIDNTGNVAELAEATRNLSYITLPILLRVTFTPKVKFFVNAGPYFGYLLKEKAKISTSDGPWDLDYTSHDKEFDWGTCFGAGAVIPFSNRFSLSTEIRSNLGFSNISKDKSVDGVVKNNTVHLVLGLVYNLSDISRDDEDE